MKRRSFVKASLLTGAAVTATSALSIAATDNIKKPALEFYELRVYSLSNDKQQKLVEDYYRKAAIPALNRMGVKHVAVFTELKPAGQTKVYVMVPYNSIDHFDDVSKNLENDARYKAEGSAYLNSPPAEPAYIRIESSLLKAFTHMPAMEVPPDRPRIFELRQYQSASESAGKKKIEMFNEGGEIDIFKRLGFKPVFWGETLIGSSRPNLTYMVTFDDMEAHAKLWKSFGSDPKWKEISSIPEYANAVLISKINSTLLVPADFSQI